MDKLDLTKTDKTYYGASKKPELIALPVLPYLQMTGSGSPESDAFKAAIEAMYTAAYSIKALCKQAEQDFTVAKLEGLWWVEDMSLDPLETPRELWQWTLLIRQPDYVTAAIAEEGLQTAMKKKPHMPVERVSFGQLSEGTCVQMLHVGPFSTEPETLAIMYAYIEEQGLAISGKHHEIYLSDFRKTAEESLRTILRYPVSK
ncbi:GyrI-like domain-containing protein [Paenibacillus lignilyticus]|uniref:GyrI-like domain-containing protein n=1 Tax=Paenibacillus lignilyticus TaxID=1172615 RepID=A0ABS5CKK1_9BACL|nr:GyrI-like domain-containing protein [Paenibacillus lignilyticus]MBP3966396.1 GyrI-like domain-containing protein [Paenibacillus lignilyticus]